MGVMWKTKRDKDDFREQKKIIREDSKLDDK